MANWAFRVHNWQQDSSNNIGITAPRHDEEDDNIYLMLNRAWDTQSNNAPIQDMNMNNQKFINAAAGSNATDFAIMSQVQSSVLSYAVATGSAGAFLVALTPAATAYTAGMVVRFKANHTPTGACTINVNGLGVKNIVRDTSIALTGGEIVNNQLVTLIYDGTNFQIDSNLNGTLTQTGVSIYAADTGAADAYVVTLSPAIGAYATGQIVRFKASNANTGASTVNVNSLGVKSIVKEGALALGAGDIKANQIVELIYDGTNFQLISPVSYLVNQNGTQTYAADTGAANAYVITLSPAPTAYVTGQHFQFKASNSNTTTSTLNVNSLGAKTIKKSVSTNLASGDILANQIVSVVYDGTDFQITSPLGGAGVINIATAGLATGGPITSTGTITVTAASQSDQETGTSTTVAVTPGVQKYHPSSSKAWLLFTSVGTTAIIVSYNVTSVTDNGTGDTTITFTTAFSSADYAAAGIGNNTAAAVLIRNPASSPTTTAYRVIQRANGGAAADDIGAISFFGDQ